MEERDGGEDVGEYDGLEEVGYRTSYGDIEDRDDAEEEEEEMVREEYLGGEGEILNGDTNVDGLDTIKTMCETYCHRLNLSSPISRAATMSQLFAQKIDLPCRREGASPSSIAAVSVFVTSHLLGAPRSLDSVSEMCSVNARSISELYVYVAVCWISQGLIDEEMLDLVGRGSVSLINGLSERKPSE